MRRLAADRELAFEVAIEGNAEPQEILDARAGLACKRQCDLLVDDAAAHRHRVRRMRFCAVTFGYGCGNATLRPGTGGAFAQRRRRNESDRTRCKLQRAK